ncbi:hydrogenase membrane subunit [Dehalococcoides mccartyi]|uniref:proton-conducting transporter transmembrane domain-containing protein n=1 Tax=Dehalococcoides mccartyi TaxID=61435 RepID=UPI0002B75D52|nr:proton-conducting transporter membrane subunit [Dehalococcoides mccartyi]AGG08579.1 Ech-hydrogenase-related complex putative proton pumping subunit [Dehalococcoides mccartyi BTF08]KSV18250.1 hydrogenase membrane subunit [Dehalococcoides mccartyi]
MIAGLLLGGGFLLLAAALTGIVFNHGSKKVWQGVLWLVIAAALCLLIGSLQIFFGNPLDISLWSIASGLDIAFHLDRLASFFVIIISLISLCVAVYSLGYNNHISSNERANLLSAFMAVFILSMIGVVASANTFSLIFFWEIMALSSFFLMMNDYQEPFTQRAGVYYFVLTQLSTIFLMLMAVVMYIQNGSFALSLSGASSVIQSLVFVLAFLAFGIKAGIIPLHKWLPYAHSASPSNVSALMSGVMLKVAIYGLVRFLMDVLSPEMWWGVGILLLGMISALLGIIYAFKEHDLKMLLAFCSIENIGIILMGIGLYVIFGLYGLDTLAMLALGSALFHSLNHAIFKSLLFMTAGSVVIAVGDRNIEKMGGLVKLMPYTSVIFLVGAVSISALPPFNGFMSELMLFESFFQSFSLAESSIKILLFSVLAILALTSALAAACFVKAFGTVFLAMPRSQEAASAKEVSKSMIIGPAILAVACLVLGLFAVQIFSVAGYSFDLPDMSLVGLVLVIFGVLVFGMVRLFSPRKSRRSETWACGYVRPTPRFEYTASGFAEPLFQIFRLIYRTRHYNERSYEDNQQAIFKQGKSAIHTIKFFDEYIYLPVAGLFGRISRFISRLQDVDLGSHILYSFITVLLVILAARWLW